MKDKAELRTHGRRFQGGHVPEWESQNPPNVVSLARNSALFGCRRL